MPSMKPGDFARSLSASSAATPPANRLSDPVDGGFHEPTRQSPLHAAPSSSPPPASPEQTAALRDALRAAIEALTEEKQRHDDLTQAQDRCRGERREVELALADTRDRLDALQRDSRAVAYGYLRGEDTRLPLGEIEAKLALHRDELSRLDEIDRALSSELARCEERLRDGERKRRQAVSDVLAADSAFLALIAELDHAWARLRSGQGGNLSGWEDCPVARSDARANAGRAAP